MFFFSCFVTKLCSLALCHFPFDLGEGCYPKDCQGFCHLWPIQRPVSCQRQRCLGKKCWSAWVDTKLCQVVLVCAPLVVSSMSADGAAEIPAAVPVGVWVVAQHRRPALLEGRGLWWHWNVSHLMESTPTHWKQDRCLPSAVQKDGHIDYLNTSDSHKLYTLESQILLMYKNC